MTSNNHTYMLPVSVKGIVFEHDKVWLRKNERNEWELPGGKMDGNEQPEQTVVRELAEELGFETVVAELVNVHKYIIKKSTDESRGVLVISYLCNLIRKIGKFEEEGEAGRAEFNAFTLEEIEKLNMPDFYRVAIKDAAFLLRTS